MDIIGLTEIKRSLRTRDSAAARIARRHYDLEVEQRFAAARARLPLDLPAKLRRNASKETLSADDRAYMLARVEHRLLDRMMTSEPRPPPRMVSSGTNTLISQPRNLP